MRNKGCCNNCEWHGMIEDAAFEMEPNDWTGECEYHPICPDCGGGLDYYDSLDEAK